MLCLATITHSKNYTIKYVLNYSYISFKPCFRLYTKNRKWKTEKVNNSRAFDGKIKAKIIRKNINQA